MRLESLLRYLGFALAIFTLVAPFLGFPGLADTMFRTCTLATIAISWNIMAGAGLISLGQSGFWGIGAYAAVLCANLLGMPFFPSLGVAIVAGALIGLGLASITGRLRGIYFAIATLAMSEGFRVLAIMLPELTGGAQGVYLNSELFPGTTTVYFMASLGAVFAALVSLVLSRTRSHYAFRAMRANERAAQMVGINPMLYRMMIVTISGAMASYGGAMAAWNGGYLDPSVAFSLHTSAGSRILLFISGAASLILAVLAFRHFGQGYALLLLAIWIGIGFIFRGVATTATAFAEFHGTPGRGWSIFFGLVSIIAGVVVLGYPFDSLVTLTLVVGVWLIVIGVLEIIAGIQLRKTGTEVRSAVNEVIGSR